MDHFTEVDASGMTYFIHKGDTLILDETIEVRALDIYWDAEVVQILVTNDDNSVWEWVDITRLSA